MLTVAQIDWLSVTLPETEDFRELFSLWEWRFVGRGMHGYRSRYVSRKNAAVVDTDALDPTMGSHFTLSGDTLAILRSGANSSDGALLNRFIRHNGKASRIDLALDLRQAKLKPATLKADIKRQRAKFKGSAWRWIEGKSGNVEGSTIYLGSPDSDRQLRCYDKAAEMGINDGRAWVRLELELRRVRANGAMQSAARNGVPETIRGHMADYLDWGNREYQQALQGEVALPDDIQKPDTDRQKWLLGQVAVALAQEMLIDPTFIERLAQTAKEQMTKIQALDKGLTKP